MLRLLRMLLIIVEPERRRYSDKDENHLRRPMPQAGTQSLSLPVQITWIVRHTLVTLIAANTFSDRSWCVLPQPSQSGTLLP